MPDCPTASWRGLLLLVAVIGVSAYRTTLADGDARTDKNAKSQVAVPGEDPKGATKPVRPAKPLLGRHFWGDVEYFQGWRIQHDVQTDQFRLIAPDDAEKDFGSLEQCRTTLQQVRQDEKLPDMQGEAVILIHGIARSGKSFQKLQLHLQKEGYTAIAFDYPSTRVDIPSAAAYLNSVVDSLHGVRRIHLVAHSMGGLVVRAYLSKHQDPRLDRLVMIATPNQGAHLADTFRSNVIYKMALGPAGQQLAGDADGFISRLPTPSLEFSVIAGGRGTPDGFSPLIPGDDDGTVAVLSTRLPGAVDFTVLPHKHTILVEAPETLECAARFLKEGRLRNDLEPRPITRENVATVGGKKKDSRIQLIGNTEPAPSSKKEKGKR